MNATKYLILAAMGLGLASVGCSSSATCGDGGACAGAGGGAGKGAGGAGLGGAGVGGAGGGVAPFGLTAGTYCFDIVDIALGSADGCMIGVAGLVSTPTKQVALPVTYYAVATTVGGVAIPAGTVEVGTDGSLGRGVINANKATLLRDDGAVPDTDVPACLWHQTDTAMFELTATNEFTISVVENQADFSADCTTAGLAPVGGACTSTWTWTMAIESPQAFIAPACK